MAKEIPSMLIPWKNRRVVVTGGCGFLGRHLIEQLKKHCDYVFAVDKKEYDLTHTSHVVELLQNTNPDIVIHLAAAVGGIGANKANPGKFFYDNMIMGCNIMEQARQYGVLKVVNVGSSCCYPKELTPPFKEENIWDGNPEKNVASYAWAKRMMLIMSQGYREQYGFNSITVLPTNLYGPDDNFDLSTSHVMPALIRKFSESKGVVEVWGSGKATREFIHVDDCARAIILAAERYDKSEPVNIGTGEEVSIEVLVEMIRTYTKFKGTVVWDRSKPDGKPRSSFDVSKAEKEFGFKAEIHLEVGLQDTIKWYKNTYGGNNA